MDLLGVLETEQIDDDEYRVTVNFNGYVGYDENYDVIADNEEDAEYQALEEASMDFVIENYEMIEDIL